VLPEKLMHSKKEQLLSKSSTPIIDSIDVEILKRTQRQQGIDSNRVQLPPSYLRAKTERIFPKPVRFPVAIGVPDVMGGIDPFVMGGIDPFSLHHTDRNQAGDSLWRNS
jgi:hypothetical protein